MNANLKPEGIAIVEPAGTGRTLPMGYSPIKTLTMEESCLSVYVPWQKLEPWSAKPNPVVSTRSDEVGILAVTAALNDASNCFR